MRRCLTCGKEQFSGTFCVACGRQTIEKPPEPTLERKRKGRYMIGKTAKQERAKAKKRCKVLKIKKVPAVFKDFVLLKKAAPPEKPQPQGFSPTSGESAPEMRGEVSATLAESALADNTPIAALPEPALVLVELIASGKVRKIEAVDPDPTLWERLEKWFKGE